MIGRVELLLLEPRVVLTLLGGYSTFGVLVKHFSYKIFGFITDVFPVVGVETELLLHDVPEDLLIVVAFEGRIAAQENKQNDSQTPNIAGLIVIPLQHLRSYIVGRSNHRFQVFSFLIGCSLKVVLAKSLGQAEVDQFYFGVFRVILKQKVFRLEVPVADLMFVEVLDGREHLLHQISCFLFAKPSVLHNFVEQLSALSQLHDDVDVAVINIALVELDDVGVVYLPQYFQFFFQQSDFLFDILTEDTFDGILNCGVSLASCQPHCTKLAASNELFEFVDLSHVEI